MSSKRSRIILSDDVFGHVEELKQFYHDAETSINHIEQNLDAVATAPVNELRYAGYHLLKALTVQDEQDCYDELGRAKKHCQRAIYDANDAGIIFYLRAIKGFQEDYAKLNITELISDYPDVRERVRGIRDFIKDKRLDAENRGDFYASIQGVFTELEAIHNRLELRREDLDRKLKRENMIGYGNLAGYALGVLGLIVGIVSLLA